MKINLEAVKKSLKLMGIDIDSSMKMAVPAMTNWLNSKIENIPANDNQTKGFIIIPNSHGEYYLTTAVFDEHATEHINAVSHEKLDNLLTSIINQIK